MELSSTAARALPVVDARIYPRGGLDVLSKAEVARLRDASSGGMHELLRRCALAVLTSGSASDDPRAARDLYPDFDIQVNQQDRGIRIDLTNAPAMAFVDGEIIRGVAELLFAVVRDLAYMAIELEAQRADLDTSEGITNAVFGQLRNARILQPLDPNLVVCWGGHSISRDEYLYTKQVGYELGLRGLDICTGCGPGAMKGPMKGATIAHAKQRKHNTRYIGVTEPGIIAAESPNPIVNHLVIMPDIEKRLEAFVRIGHGILVFPGGVGTAEEILYLLGILLREENADVPFPLILTGPTIAAPYFEQIDRFIRLTLGTLPPRATRSSSATQSPWRAAWPKGCTQCARTARTRKTRITSTGPCTSRSSISNSSSPATKRWPHWTCTTAARRRPWPPTCAAPSPASWPATSRKTACVASRNSALRNPRRPRDHAGPGRTPARLCRAAPDEDLWGLSALLSGGDLD